MIDREKLIKHFEHLLNAAKGNYQDFVDLTVDAGEEILSLLKEQEGYVSVPFSWLVKFCTHIDFVEPLTDAEREVAWRQKLRQQFWINAPKKAVKWE